MGKKFYCNFDSMTARKPKLLSPAGVNSIECPRRFMIDICSVLAARCDGMAVFECPPLREYAELCNDPSGCEVRKDKVEARAKTRRSYDRVGTGTGR